MTLQRLGIAAPVRLMILPLLRAHMRSCNPLAPHYWKLVMRVHRWENDHV